MGELASLEMINVGLIASSPLSFSTKIYEAARRAEIWPTTFGRFILDPPLGKIVLSHVLFIP